MAQTKCLCTCIFILVLICSCGVFDTEARHLKRLKEVEKSSSATNGGDDEYHNKAQLQHIDTNAVKDVKDFRPTEPGHSPGVGHSIQN